MDFKEVCSIIDCAIIKKIKGYSMQNYQNMITINPNIRSGKPIIRGMRITVYDVLDMLSDRMSFNEIIEDYPELTEDDIYAVLSYAADKEHNLLICA